MTTLSTADRQRIWRGVMRYWSREHEELAVVNKTELQAAVDATDDWIDANQASFNAALPEPFASNATAAQKTFLFVVVAAMRVSPALARQIVGEVD